MESKNLIILGLVAVVLVLAGVIAGMTLSTPTNDTNNTTNETNDTTNITLNDTNDTNNTTTSTNTNTNTKKSTAKKTSKSSGSDVVDEYIRENKQAGDGSYYRQVEYRDGNIRQYDLNGRLIGSSYDSDQAQLKRQAGDSWPGD